MPKNEEKKEHDIDTEEIEIKNETEQNKVVSDVEKGVLATIGLFFLELVKIVILAGITIVLVRYFLFKPFYVKGESMQPNFFEREYLIIDEISYRFREPMRGEVVVFKAPIGDKDYYLKRIIGLPGERVKVEDNKVIIFNQDHPQGIVVEEIYLEEVTPGSVTIALGPGQYFVMGDNRDASFDSRRFGPVSKNEIVGRAWLRGWPFNRFDILDSPNYNL
ncbi:MAG: signal peptidase I [Candidatus Magasanikbacteria bacterium]|nr:signal peptidase I [Candidatus Magasanikbacteria bacterium]